MQFIQKLIREQNFVLFQNNTRDLIGHMKRIVIFLLKKITFIKLEKYDHKTIVTECDVKRIGYREIFCKIDSRSSLPQFIFFSDTNKQYRPDFFFVVLNLYARGFRTEREYWRHMMLNRDIV